MITKLLCVEPSRRLTAEQALQHPWFANIRGSMIDNVKNRCPATIEEENSLSAPEKDITANNISNANNHSNNQSNNNDIGNENNNNAHKKLSNTNNDKTDRVLRVKSA